MRRINDDSEDRGTNPFQITGCGYHHFTVIGQLSAQHNAINLSQGAPNFSCDPKLIAGVTRAMEAGHNQYAAMTGLQPLKERIAEKIATLTAPRMTRARGAGYRQYSQALFRHQRAGASGR